MASPWAEPDTAPRLRRSQQPGMVARPSSAQRHGMTSQSATITTELVPGIHRISTYVPDGPPGGITFNQFVVVGDESLLFHTGTRRLFPAVRDAVSTVVDVTAIR